MKNQQPKPMNTIIIIFLFIFSAAFFAYGIYTTHFSIEYVESYQSSIYVSETNRLHYIIEASIIYYGFGILFLMGAFILITFNKVQKNIFETVMQLNNRISASYDDTYNNISDDDFDFIFDETKRRKRRSKN